MLWDKLPDVPVIVTVVVVDGGLGFWPLGWLPPPHPFSTMIAAMHAIKRISRRRRRLVIFAPAAKPSHMIRKGTGTCARRDRRFAVDDAEMVKVEFAPEAIDAGAKLQVTPGGSPEQESETV